MRERFFTDIRGVGAVSGQGATVRQSISVAHERSLHSTQMKYRERQIARWTNAIPGLDGEWSHWWLEGDGGLILVTSDLAEMLEAIESNYGASLILTVSRARHTSDGDSVRDTEICHIANYAQDRLDGWHE